MKTDKKLSGKLLIFVEKSNAQTLFILFSGYCKQMPKKQKEYSAKQRGNIYIRKHIFFYSIPAKDL